MTDEDAADRLKKEIAEVSNASGEAYRPERQEPLDAPAAQSQVQRQDAAAAYRQND